MIIEYNGHAIAQIEERGVLCYAIDGNTGTVFYTLEMAKTHCDTINWFNAKNRKFAGGGRALGVNYESPLDEIEKQNQEVYHNRQIE